LFGLAKPPPKAHHVGGVITMAGTDQRKSDPGLPEISEHDILFECPACGKSLVVDETAAGLMVPCPQCSISVIVPPKPAPAKAPVPKPVVPPPRPPSPPPPAKPVAGPVAKPDALDWRGRLLTLGQRLSELQAQRTEINTRLASRANELTRDLVLLSRLETTQQQLLAEWNQLANQLKPGARDEKTSA
jgi:DNA-directed RNA polymerase subunit RPC12/RpoP